MAVAETQLQDFRRVLRELVRRLGKEQAVGGSCCGLSFAQCHPLQEIDRRGRTTVRELAAALDLDKSTLSRTVEGLVRRGLVVRREDSEDRRVRQLSLTVQGRRILREIEGKADARFASTLTRIPQGQRSELLRHLERLVLALRE